MWVGLVWFYWHSILFRVTEFRVNLGQFNSRSTPSKPNSSYTFSRDSIVRELFVCLFVFSRNKRYFCRVIWLLRCLAFKREALGPVRPPWRKDDALSQTLTFKPAWKSCSGTPRQGIDVCSTQKWHQFQGQSPLAVTGAGWDCTRGSGTIPSIHNFTCALNVSINLCL